MNALTAQGKATATFIGCLPYGITLMTYLASPGYIVPFLKPPDRQNSFDRLDHLGRLWLLDPN